MTIEIDLPEELANRLQLAAQEQGISADSLTIHLLEKHLPAPNREKELVALLQSWLDSPDSEEQKETGDLLIRALDEDRLSDRKLFPEELKGVTW